MDYRDLVITDLADSEAALKARVFELETDLAVYREVCLTVFDALRNLTRKHDQVADEYWRLCDEYRSFREEVFIRDQPDGSGGPGQGTGTYGRVRDPRRRRARDPATGPGALDRLRAAQQTIARDGQTFRDRFGQIRAHPLLAVERDARAPYLSALRQLNLDVEPLQSRPGRPSGPKD